MKSKRLLIFVISYEAEKTIQSVLDRIPSETYNLFETEILVLDDASKDKTFQCAINYKKKHKNIKITVFKNEFNLGYGGNQKLGYLFAIKGEFDYVAMVHGDGQYAPEELIKLLQPFKDEKVGAVFGSRMMSRTGALKGGMPLYKFLGNKVLTKIQNLILKSNLTEFHSGYRIYATETLKNIPFQLNSNNWHFDTEIIIQLLNSDNTIVELPIPTHYGDEICRVNGMKYALNVLISSLKSAIHNKGILYQPHYDVNILDNQNYDLKLGYRSSHSLAIDCIPEGESVLDIGGGQGYIASYLNTYKKCSVCLLDQYDVKEKNPNIEYVQQNLNDEFKVSLEKYNYILMLDIIEHVQNPEKFLFSLSQQFNYKKKVIIITVPNVAFIVQRVMLLFGQFNYGKSGILDRTHSRLFTFRSLKYLLKFSNFKLVKIKGIPAPFPKAFGDNKFSRFLVNINILLILIAPKLFSYQIYAVAESHPQSEFILENTRKYSETNEKAI